MDLEELKAQVQASLGTADLVPLTVGGQKLVFTTELGGVPAVAKVVLVPDGPHADEVIERARREVELLSTVESTHVVRVLSEAVEIGDRPDAVCWVEERLDGADLRDLSASLPWGEDEVWTLLRDVARGLAACHDLDVVHRDLSPGNIRRRSDGRFVVMDPGFARHLSKAAITGVYQPGTPGYMTPEHTPGGHPTPASDVFGLGILAFEALTTKVPVPYRGDEAEYYRQLRTGQAPALHELDSGVSPELAAVVDRCLNRQPARRYIDAIEMLEALPSGVGS